MEASLVGTSYAQLEISLVEISIIMIEQTFGRDNVGIEPQQILSKEELTYLLLLFAMRRTFETLVEKSTKSLLVVKEM